MRTLNRPMFRYGGPIKEGVMHGIREPKQNGGTIAGGNQIGMPMGNRTGFADPVKSAGYFSKLGSALANFYNPLKKGKIISKLGLTKIPKTRTNIPQGPQGSGVGGVPMFKTQTKIPGMERAGMFVRNNPKTTGALAIGATSDPVIGAGKMVGGGLKGIADFLTPGWVQRALEKEKLEKDIKTSTETANEKRIKELEALLAAPASKNQGKTQDELRQDRIQKYRDIMDIKGMNKNAAYDSLIAASQAINQSGDFKGDLKSGKLINQIIQSTSKAFDKPKATKDAIDTLILKGEIESDIAAGKPSTYLKAAQDMVATGAAKNITEAMKTLTKSENSMSTTLGAILAKGNRLDEKTVGVAYREETGNIPNGSIKISEVNEWKEENKGKNEIDYVKEIMKVSELAPGDYIIGERVVTIDENMKPTFFY